MGAVTRDTVRHILLSWQAGQMAPRDVHEWASDHYPTHETVADDLVIEILARLDMLDMNLMTPDDIPVLVNALDLPEQRMDEAFRLLEQHDAAVDIATRKQKLGNDPFYRWFCT